MKSHIKILSLSLLTFVLLCQGITGNIICITADPASEVFEDTLDLKRLVMVDLFMLQILPPSSGVQFYKDKIVFLSKAKNERKIAPDHISFGAVEAYYAAILDSVEGSHQIFSPGNTVTYPCEAMTFTRDYSTIYFSKLDMKSGKEKIFVSPVAMNEKGQPELSTDQVMLDFCTGNFNYSHPALSSDGNLLIYASDRDGSLGGMDLFVSRQAGGKWSAPENPGKMFNTTGNEYFPFLDQDNNLYFSSDMLPGHGGYDIFSCKFNGAGWNAPVNLSEPVNSPYDDIAFTMNKTDGKTAFITRKSDKNFQLFRISAKLQVSDKNLVSVFNGSPAPKTESLITKTDTLAGRKPEQMISETKVPAKTSPDKKVTVTGTVSASAVAKSVIIKPTLAMKADQKDVVIYRVQILSANSPKREKTIVLEGKSYDLYEYFYLGSYRYSIGEYRTLSPAMELQRICRKANYPQAFVAGFKNNTRSTDLKLFK